MGQSMTVAGKFSSNTYQFLKVEIKRCNPTTDFTCANDTTFATEAASYGSFELILAVVHPNINAGNEDYKTYFIDTQKTLVFTAGLGISAETYIREDTVSTDQSILPWEDNLV